MPDLQVSGKSGWRRSARRALRGRRYRPAPLLACAHRSCRQNDFTVSAVQLPELGRGALADAQLATRLLVGSRARLDRRAGEAARLLGALHPREVLDLWGHQGVPVWAIERARSIGVTHPSWDDAERALRLEARDSAAIQGLITRQIAQALGRERIEAVAFKGPAMARRLYGDPSTRYRSADIDVLVPTHRLRDAGRIVEGLGWSPPRERGPQGALPEIHHTHVGPGETPSVELHWRVQWYDAGEHSAQVLRRAVDQDGIVVPSAVDQLGILLFCFARDGFHRLRLVSDIAAWWDRYGDEWGETAFDEFRRSPLRRPLEATALAASDLAGVPAPSDGDRDRGIRLAIGAATADRPAPKRRVYGQVALVDVLVAPPIRVRERIGASWFRPSEALLGRFPGLDRAALRPALRLLSAARSAVFLPGLLTRAWRAGSLETRSPDSQRAGIPGAS